jgi:uncharacterized protein YfiM (DUF2279 family)
MKRRKPYCHRQVTLFLLIIYSCFSWAQIDSVNYSLRKKIVIGGNVIGTTALMTGLYSLWYKDYPKSSFHFYNDNDHWNQMDKIGHAFSCYYEGLVGIKMMKWAGYNHLQSTLIGGSYGLFIQTGVEIMDGFSEEWGFSKGDMYANIGGTALLIGQSLLWKEQRIKLKFSFFPSDYSAIRPNLLGSTFPEKLLKDYNGQNYWLSLNIKSFIPDSNWPDWLNIAFGYGSNGMITGTPGNVFIDNEGIERDFSHITRYRQYYISPDIDFSKIKSKNSFVRSMLIVVNCLKFPLPTIEFNQNKLNTHWVAY